MTERKRGRESSLKRKVWRVVIPVAVGLGAMFGVKEYECRRDRDQALATETADARYVETLEAELKKLIQERETLDARLIEIINATPTSTSTPRPSPTPKPTRRPLRRRNQ